MLKYVSRQTMNTIFLDLSAYFVIGGTVLLVGIIVLVILIARRKPGAEEEEEVIDDSEWLIALGDKDNIKSVSVRGSRLSVELNDDKLINREQLTSLGVKSIITMSNKLILVIENNASEIADRIQSNLSENN